MLIQTMPGILAVPRDKEGGKVGKKEQKQRMREQYHRDFKLKQQSSKAKKKSAGRKVK
jgi:hypothetical protein